MSRMSFHEKLTKLIAKRETSQSKLAVKTRIPQSTISDFSNDKQRPYLDQAFTIARALNASLDYMADDTMKEEPEGLSEDDQAVLDHFHTSGLTRKEAMKWLSLGIQAKASEGKPDVATHGQSDEEKQKGRRKEG